MTVHIYKAKYEEPVNQIVIYGLLLVVENGHVN